MCLAKCGSLVWTCRVGNTSWIKEAATQFNEWEWPGMELQSITPESEVINHQYALSYIMTCDNNGIWQAHTAANCSVDSYTCSEAQPPSFDASYNAPWLRAAARGAPAPFEPTADLPHPR